MTNTMTPSEIEPALDLVSDVALELIATQDKLKIATEALEAIEVTYPEGSGARVEASCALARIKEAV